MKTIWQDFVDRYGRQLFNMTLLQTLEAFYWFVEGHAGKTKKLIKEFAGETEEEKEEG